MTQSKRTYNSSRRQEGARLTRQAIGQAALQLFIQRGYQGATLDAIAAAAAVAPETIYATFGSKREILHYLMDTSIGGDEQPLQLIDRPEQQAVLQETDARRLLAGFSEGIGRILERAAPVFAILTEAARTESGLEGLYNRMRAERHDNMRRVVRSLARLEALRLDEAQATDTLWALTSPELYLLLTRARAWSREQFSAWLNDSLARLLLVGG
jgi:TetR/AcrR family transcriptional regulator of autoinduction and epiphytic fitness